MRRLTTLIAVAMVCAIAAAQDGFGRWLFTEGWRFKLGDDVSYSSTEYDDSGWRELSIPHDWAIEGDFDKDNPSGTGGGALPGGVGWYRNTFQLPALDVKGKRVRVDFDGVYMNASVFVNGHLLGTRPYGYMSFGYDITEYLKFGKENVIAVRVDNKEQPNSRWYSGCGIYRNAYITMTPAVHVDNNGVFVTAEVGKITIGDDGKPTADEATVTIRTTICNESAKKATVPVISKIYNAGGSLVATCTLKGVQIMPGDTTVVTQTAKVSDPELWSTSTPNLYHVETSLSNAGKAPAVVATSFVSMATGHFGVGAATDLAIGSKKRNLMAEYKYTTTFGIRRIKFTDNGFYLNDQPMQIQGVCNHHDLGCLGAAVNRRAIQRQLEIMRGMGINGIRCSHNPPSPELLDLCDEMGFIVMDESFDMWRKKKTAHDYARYFNEWHERDLYDFIVRDRNHPSICIWSIGNEVLEQWSDAKADTLSLEEANLILNFGHSADQLASADGEMTVNALLTKKLADFVRNLDDSRPITAGCNEPAPGNHLFKSGALDIIGFNYHNQNIPDVKRNFPGKPFIITESVSALQTRGYYRMPSDSMFVWPERWDKPFYDESYSCSSYDNCHAPWSNTHEENLLVMKKNPWITGQYIWTGFDYIGEPTPYGWPARSSYFGIVDLAGFPKDVYYLYQSELTDKDVLHLFPHWNWAPGQDIDLWCYYNNADEVELLVNGVSQGKRSKTDDQLHVVWRTTYQPGEVKAVAYKNGKAVREQVIKTAGEPDHIRLTADRYVIDADGVDLSYITVEVLDKDGNLCPNADNLINFTTTKGVKIAGVDNGSPISLERFKDNKRKAFYGKCLLVVQNDGSKGESIITATSQGIKSATLNLRSK